MLKHRPHTAPFDGNLFSSLDVQLIAFIFSFHRTADGGGLVEKHYVFLKRLCQVLCALGNQLCALLVSTYFLESFRAI